MNNAVTDSPTVFAAHVQMTKTPTKIRRGSGFGGESELGM